MMTGNPAVHAGEDGWRRRVSSIDLGLFVPPEMDVVAEAEQHEEHGQADEGGRHGGRNGAELEKNKQT